MSPAKSKIEILTSALIDIDQIANYHMEIVGPLSAEKITDSLLDSIEILKKFPLAGVEHTDPFLQSQGFRKQICGDYLAIYRIIDDTVTIYRVFHSTRNYINCFK